MRFVYGRNDWSSMARGQENCYLITNGLGGYSSLSIIGSNARNDHALLMACTKAPNYRVHMVSKVEEVLQLAGEVHPLSSQEYVVHTSNKTGYTYLQQFQFEAVPIWYYQVEGIEIKKTIVMRHRENTIGIRYELNNRMALDADFTLIPELQFVAKGESISQGQSFTTTDSFIASNGHKLYYKTNASVELEDTSYTEDLYYSYDARDGRDAIGKTAKNHSLHLKVASGKETVLDLIYSMKPIEVEFDQIYQEELARQQELLVQADITDPIGMQLVRSADQFVVDRESTQGKSIMAGYPFFADWGRDTMIALVGCCISTRRFEEAKGMFRTFMQYSRKGLMPNMFPEGGSEPIYNTVDASLLFITAVYEYYLESKDLEFVKEAYPVMEDILAWYQKGTDFHIRMDEDGLIEAGGGYDQVTWMDVRFGDILPTPRHGKPVEINAYWYNANKILGVFASLFGKDNQSYERLAEKVKLSFRQKFWNEEKGCLKDLISGTGADEQIRCNQIWAVSLPFTMLARDQEIKVVNKVYERLYTPYGLRSLDKHDPDFKASYGGSHFNRDMAYHQGTVWAFPLGAYYLAYLKVNENSSAAVQKVKEQLSVLEAGLREGCVGQIAEIYDGDLPTISEGCYAQAWSVSEILRVYAALEKQEK
ncbi:MAG: glycogen debranching enzyme [Firmicutes bacterium]|nr:glycogen debranching enzyme [Bacillota bacterium]